MPSTNKTSNLKLNSWVGTDKPTMEDFNADNVKLDTVIGNPAKLVHSEEGEFKSVLVNTGSTTYERQFGSYVKQGNVVSIWGEIVIKKFDTNQAGNAFEIALPFPIGSVQRTLMNIDFVGNFRSIPENTSHVFAYGSGNTNFVRVMTQSSCIYYPVLLNQTVLKDNSRFMFSMTYKTK